MYILTSKHTHINGSLSLSLSHSHACMHTHTHTHTHTFTHTMILSHPLASGCQCGARRPEKAGTKYTPPVSSTLRACSSERQPKITTTKKHKGCGLGVALIVIHAYNSVLMWHDEYDVVNIPYVHVYWGEHFYKEIGVYHIAWRFGGELNLVVWQSAHVLEQPPH